MTNKAEAITDKRRKQITGLIREAKAASPTVEADLLAYEAALTASEQRVKELEEAYEFIQRLSERRDWLHVPMHTEEANSLGLALQAISLEAQRICAALARGDV